MAELLFESMTRIELPPFYVIRCWRQEEDYSAKVKWRTKEDIENAIRDSQFGPSQITDVCQSAKDIAMCLIELPRMNAVEVLNSDQLQGGNGLVIYKDWP